LNGMKGVCSISRKKLIKGLIAVPIAVLALLYGSGYLSQLLYNYERWQAAGGVYGTAPDFPDPNFFLCLAAALHLPYGLYGLGICMGLLALLILMVMRMGYSDAGVYDSQRNLTYSNKGTYGTAGFMSKRELKGVLDLVPDIRKHHGTILGELDGQVVCIPEKTRFNGNLAVYGASGSKKTRAFCVNMILQCAARKSSLVICDPKSELYEKTSEYLRSHGYTVRVFNLVTPAASDSWNCLSEIEGQELMAQLFCDVIIKNTGSERGDHFWDNAELNLLKALVLYVERGYPPEKKNIGEVYRLLSMSSEKELNALFDVLPVSHPAKVCAAASSSVWGPGFRCSKTGTFAILPHMTRSTWSCRESSRALTSVSPATRTQRLTFSRHCFFLSFSSSWCGMRMNTARVENCLFPFMYWGRNYVPAA